ncbi:MAG TPA: hypothetical protein VG722_05245 [Tepidisphaeraceae bacterium]|nr:hypothetical protein [Tepidisphaeraceae bacterium]
MADAIARVRRHWEEVCEFFSHYVSVKIDRLMLSVKMLVVYAALGTLAMIGLAALLITAAVQICYGLAHLLTAAFGGRLWLGELVTGVIIWLLMVAVVFLGIMTWVRKSRRTTLEKYEKRRAQQRSDFGHDAQERAKL